MTKKQNPLQPLEPSAGAPITLPAKNLPKIPLPYLSSPESSGGDESVSTSMGMGLRTTQSLSEP